MASMRSLRAWRRAEEGAELIEFMIVFPILMLILAGIMDFGMLLRNYEVVTNAAREGARWVSTHPENPVGAMARVTAEAERIGLSPDAVDDSLIMVTFTPNKASYTAGEDVTVSVAHDYQLLFGIVTAIPEISFETSATMTVLYEE